MTLTPIGYRNRLIEPRLKQMMRVFGAVSIEGPKWSGKTWCARSICNSETRVTGSNGAVKNIDLIRSNPSSALKGEQPHLIDEWQECPSLWDEVRNYIDDNASRGAFVLTGSSVPKRDGYLHSGTGRIGKIMMDTMTLYETGDSDGSVSMRSLLEGDLETVPCGDVALETLADFIIRGGWPSSIESDPADYGIIPGSYIEEAIEDACSLDGRKLNKTKMTMMLKALARNETSLASNSRITNDMREHEDETLTMVTYNDYHDCLDRIHLIDDTPCFKPDVRSDWRIGKTPKRHLIDVSLSAAALGLDRNRLISDLNTFGLLFEALCEHDLRIYAESMGCKLFHYRDGRGREIDAVIESSDGSWSAIEIKLGFGQVDSAAESLLKMKRLFEEEGNPPKNLIVVCGMTAYAYTRPDGVKVVPITSLGP